MFNNFHQLLDSFASGFLKRVLYGAGLTLGTSGVIAVTLNKMIESMQDSATNLPPFAVAMADLAGLDLYISAVVGAIVTRYTLKSSNIVLQKLDTDR